MPEEQPTESMDIPSIQKSIDAAIATMGAEDRFNLLLHADRRAGGIGVLWKFGGHVEAVAKVTKPWRDKWEVSADVRVHFALGGYAERADPFWFQWYRAYQMLHGMPAHSPNSRTRAAVKAFGLVLNFHPYLDGRRWFA